MAKNRAKELSYYLFFSFMIFAKGIGLDSGNRLYYVLSAMACLCVGVKLALTEYKKREIVAMVLLCAIAFAAYRNSGRLGIVLSVLTIIGLKGMDVKKLFRLGAAVYGCSFAFTVTAAKLGIIGNPLVVHEKGGMELIRWGMGYSTGNVFHVSYFMLVVLLCYTWGKDYDWKRLFGLMMGNLLVCLYTLSYTGVSVTAFYLLLNLYAMKRKGFCRAERMLCQLPLPLCLLFSFGAPFLLQYPAVQKLDGMMQSRLSFSAYYLQNQPITLLGARMKNVPNFWVIMDNGYVYFFMTFGVAAFVLFCMGYAVVIGRYSGVGQCFSGKGKREGQEERLPELAMIFSFLLYGIMEQFLSNAFMNFSLLFLGEVLFGRQGVRYAGGEKRMGGKAGCIAEGEKAGGKAGCIAGGEKAGGKPGCIAGGVKKGRRDEGFGWNGRYFGGLACGVVGAGIFAVYFLAVPVKEYVCVPVKALNYVQAQSVQMCVVDNDGMEDDLKDKMRAYGEALEKRDLLSAAIREAGMEDKISEEELAAALEYSVPVYVQDSEAFDTFRIRLLELYYDMAEEEYRALLEHMVALAQKAEEGEYFVKDGIYAEKIEKSSGEDRIEHMSTDKGYEVEKAGKIVKMEHIRDSVFYAVLGMAVLGAVWQAAIKMKIRAKKLF